MAAAAVIPSKWCPNKISLIRGQADNFAIFLLQPDGTPLNISGATAIILMYKNSAGAVIEKAADTGWQWGLGDKLFYVYGFSFSADETNALGVSKDETVVVKIMYGEMPRYLTIASCLTVTNMIFAS